MNEGQYYIRLKEQIDSLFGELRSICGGERPDTLRSKEYAQFLRLNNKSPKRGVDFSIYDYEVHLEPEYGRWNQEATICVFLVETNRTDFPKECLMKQAIELRIMVGKRSGWYIGEEKIAEPISFIDKIHRYLTNDRFENPIAD